MPIVAECHFALKLRQKIGRVLRPLSYRRGWRRTRRLLWPLPLGPLLANLDQDRLREIQTRYATSTNHYVKYAEVDRFSRENRKRIQDLGASSLHGQARSGPPMRRGILSLSSHAAGTRSSRSRHRRVPALWRSYQSFRRAARCLGNRSVQRAARSGGTV